MRALSVAAACPRVVFGFLDFVVEARDEIFRLLELDFGAGGLLFRVGELGADLIGARLQESRERFLEHEREGAGDDGEVDDTREIAALGRVQRRRGAREHEEERDVAQSGHHL